MIIMETYPTSTDLAAVRDALARQSRQPERDVLIFELLRGCVRLSELAWLGMPIMATVGEAPGVAVPIRRAKTTALDGGSVILLGEALDTLNAFLLKREEMEGQLASNERLFPASGPLALPSAAVVRRVLTRAAEQAGVSRPVNARSMRAGTITEWAAAGVPLEELVARMRHRSADSHCRHYGWRWLG